jgi:hypothetical protein
MAAKSVTWYQTGKGLGLLDCDRAILMGQSPRNVCSHMEQEHMEQGHTEKWHTEQGHWDGELSYKHGLLLRSSRTICICTYGTIVRTLTYESVHMRLCIRKCAYASVHTQVCITQSGGGDLRGDWTVERWKAPENEAMQSVPA